MKQLQEKHNVDARLVIGPNRAYQIIGIAAIAFLALSVVVIVNKDRANALLCSQGGQNIASKACNVNNGIDQALLYLVIAMVGLIALCAIYRPIRYALNWVTFVFDRNSHNFSMDGETISRLSDIKEVKVNKVGTRRSQLYRVEINLKNRQSVRINTYMLNGSAQGAAERISSFLGVPKKEEESSEW